MFGTACGEESAPKLFLVPEISETWRRRGSWEPQRGEEEQGPHGQKGKRQAEENGAVRITRKGGSGGPEMSKLPSQDLFLSPDLPLHPCLHVSAQKTSLQSCLADH